MLHILHIYEGKVQKNIQVTQKMKIGKNNHMASKFAIQITIEQLYIGYFTPRNNFLFYRNIFKIF